MNQRREWVTLDLGAGLRTVPLAAAIDGDHLLVTTPCPGVVSAVLLDHDHEAAAVAWLERPRAEVVALTGWLSRVPDGQGSDVLRLRVRGALCGSNGLVRALDLRAAVAVSS